MNVKILAGFGRLITGVCAVGGGKRVEQKTENVDFLALFNGVAEITLPLHTLLSDDDVAYVAEVFKRAYAKALEAETA